MGGGLSTWSPCSWRFPCDSRGAGSASLPGSTWTAGLLAPPLGLVSSVGAVSVAVRRSALTPVHDGSVGGVVVWSAWRPLDKGNEIIEQKEI